MGIPRMVLVGAAVLALDALAILLLVLEEHLGAALLYQLSTVLGALGGMEALHWMATRSPWAPPGVADREAATLRNRMQAVPWGDREWLRAAILRLLSGGVLAFFLLTVIFLFPPHRLPPWAYLPYLLLLLQLGRLAGPGVSASVLAPLVLFSSPVPSSPRDRFHAGLAAGLSLLALALLYVKAGSPPPADFLANLVLVALNPANHAYSLMIGGIVWWKATWVARWMGREDG